jgi:hypothetical protein
VTKEEWVMWNERNIIIIIIIIIKRVKIIILIKVEKKYRECWRVF